MTRLLKGLVYLYFVVILIPVGILQKILGLDRLGLRFRKNLKTYWTEKNPDISLHQ